MRLKCMVHKSNVYTIWYIKCDDIIGKIFKLYFHRMYAPRPFSYIICR